MPISTSVWRFQCDPAGNPDPIVEVFIKDVTEVDGETFEKLNMTAVPIKFSVLASAAFNEPAIIVAVKAEMAAMLERERQDAAEFSTVQEAAIREGVRFAASNRPGPA